MIQKVKILMLKNWKNVLMWIFIPAVLVVIYYAFKYFTKPSNTEGLEYSIENRLNALNNCRSIESEYCSELLQQLMGEARSQGKNIIKLDDKYVLQ